MGRVVEGARQELSRLGGRDDLHRPIRHALGQGCVTYATAPDGVIEGIEDPRRRFCLGVQWHPEYGLSDGDRRLFAAFIAACG